MNYKILWAALPCSLVLAVNTLALELNEGIEAALKNDPLLARSRSIESAFISQAQSADEWMNPQLSLMAGNLPVDSFDLNQEAMTQLKLGITQMFPKGNSLTLKKQLHLQNAAEQPFLREDRKAQIRNRVTTLWLKALATQKSISRIKADQQWFEQSQELIQNAYSVGFGQSGSQDLIATELQLIKLENRLIKLRIQLDATLAMLSEYVGHIDQFPDQDWPISLRINQAYSSAPELHPKVLAVSQNIASQQIKATLADESNKLQWGLTGSYAYRFENSMGQDRSDLVSVGLMVELPFSNKNKARSETAAAMHRVNAIEEMQQNTLRQLTAKLNTEQKALEQLEQQLALYTEQLIPKVQEQTQAALTAYTNDQGSFMAVVKSRISELDLNIEFLNITVNKLITEANLDYLLTEGTK